MSRLHLAALRKSENRQQQTGLATNTIRQDAIRDGYEDTRQCIEGVLPAVDPGQLALHWSDFAVRFKWRYRLRGIILVAQDVLEDLGLWGGIARKKPKSASRTKTEPTRRIRQRWACLSWATVAMIDLCRQSGAVLLFVSGILDLV